MKSKASFKGHPLHPILVAFPIAFFTGAFAFDLLSQLVNKIIFWQMAYYLAIGGIAAGFMAAIPGVIDFTKTIPPNSSAKKRATKHALINITNLLLFSGVVYYKQAGNANPIIVLVMEGIGIILLTIAGWMGGTLVYKNQIGVVNRYADSGKWSEAYVDSKSAEIEVATIQDLKINQMKLVHVGNKRIVIARSEKGFVAFDDRCTHKGGSLAGGTMICGTVHCPWHGSLFDVHDGSVKSGPATEKISTYPVVEKDGKIYLIKSAIDQY